MKRFNFFQKHKIRDLGISHETLDFWILTAEQIVSEREPRRPQDDDNAGADVMVSCRSSILRQRDHPDKQVSNTYAKSLMILGLWCTLLCPINTQAKPSFISKFWPGNWFSRPTTLHDRIKQLEDAQIDKPQDPYINYNLGVAHYKDGQYNEATKNFSQSLIHLGDDLTLKKRCYFNQGRSLHAHTLALLGPNWEQEKVDDTKLNQALNAAQQACASFKTFLEFEPESSQGKKALTESEELLQKLLKKQQEQNQDKNPEEKNQEQKQQQDKNKNKQQQNKDKDKQKDQQEEPQTNKDQKSDKKPEDQQEKQPSDQQQNQDHDEKKDQQDAQSDEQKQEQQEKKNESSQKQSQDQKSQDKHPEPQEGSEQPDSPTEDQKSFNNHEKRQMEALLKSLEEQERDKQKDRTKQAMQGGKRDGRSQKPW